MQAIGNLSKREKIILALTVASIAFSLFYNLILAPSLKRLAALDKEILQLENKLLRAKRLIPKKSAIENSFREITFDLTAQEGVSAEQQIARILIELENLGNLSGTRLTDIKPGQAKSSEYYNEFTIEIRFEAAIKEVAKFIYDIQQSKELLKIEKLLLNTKSSDSPLLEGLIEIHKISI